MSAADAKAYGLIDDVIETTKELSQNGRGGSSS
jgi:ATP-dependent protease ClpP protease subunit